MSGGFGSSTSGDHLVVANSIRCFCYSSCISSPHRNVQNVLLMEVCVQFSIVNNTTVNILTFVFCCIMACVFLDYIASSEIVGS